MQQPAIISFGRYKKQLLTSLPFFRRATHNEVNRLLEHDANDSKLRCDAIRYRMEQTLAAARPEYTEALREFFSIILREQDEYEKERYQRLKSIADNPKADRIIYNDPQKGTELLVDCISDNCYEYALHDYYESRLMKLSGSSVFKQMELFSVPQQEQDRFFDFLSPGFMREWPLYQVKNLTWLMRYDAANYTVNGIRDNIFYDAACFGLQCSQVSFVPGQYTAKPGYTLFYCTLGITVRNNEQDLDYHFYRYHPRFGLWSHKPGITPVTCFDNAGQLIQDPSRCVPDYDQTVPVGFFEINIT